MKKECNNCRTEMIKTQALSRHNWEIKKFCGHRCAALYRTASGVLKNTGRTHFVVGQVSPRKGTTTSDEHKAAISRANRGRQAWNKGLYGLNAGDKNPNWRGGNSQNYLIRRTQAYKAWRKAVFDRDDYTCRVCGDFGTYITAHHIKSVARYPELALELSNGATLCEPCHALTDNYKGRERRIV